MKKTVSILVIILFIGCQKTNDINKISIAFDTDKLNQIESLINTAISKNEIPGAVLLIAKENKIVLNKAFGIKTPNNGEKYKVDDIFRIASMTKAITSLGILKLWERGLIGLDEPIEKYIPESLELFPMALKYKYFQSQQQLL